MEPSILVSPVVRGRVIDIFDTPIDRCRIYCEPYHLDLGFDPSDARNNPGASTQTGSDGRFTLRLPDSWSTSIAVTLVHRDFPPTVAARLERNALDFDLGDLALQSKRGISLQVRGTDDIEIAGARVRIQPVLLEADAPDSWQDALRALSLIHISEPTRPY